MRAIYLCQLDKVRPAVVLTREVVLPRMRRITVAAITSTARGLATEVPVGPENGLDQASVINCDDVWTVPAQDLLRPVGFLLAHQETKLARAINLAFDLYP